MAASGGGRVYSIVLNWIYQWISTFPPTTCISQNRRIHSTTVMEYGGYETGNANNMYRSPYTIIHVGESLFRIRPYSLSASISIYYNYKVQSIIYGEAHSPKLKKGNETLWDKPTDQDILVNYASEASGGLSRAVSLARQCNDNDVKIIEPNGHLSFWPNLLKDILDSIIYRDPQTQCKNLVYVLHIATI